MRHVAHPWVRTLHCFLQGKEKHSIQNDLHPPVITTRMWVNLVKGNEQNCTKVLSQGKLES